MTRAAKTGVGTDVSRIPPEMSGDDQRAVDELVPMIYAELRLLAHRQLRAERSDHTLNTTGLVHEAYIRLADTRQPNWQGRAHFMATAARVMRHVLIDYARRRRTAKRGGGWVRVEFDEALCLSEDYADAVEMLDEALCRLEKLSPRQSRLLEQRYFGGLTLEECAEANRVSLSTVKNEFRFARAWLARELGADSVV